MKNRIATINGSSRANQANGRLLKALATQFSQYSFHLFSDLSILPLFTADQDQYPWENSVIKLRSHIKESDSVIISTPSYIFNIPAVLKNALEWLSSSGELYHKPVLAVTFTPHEPRGEKAMNSLVYSLNALNARIVTTLPLYQNQISVDSFGNLQGEESILLLSEAIEILMT